MRLQYDIDVIIIITDDDMTLYPFESIALNLRAIKSFITLIDFILTDGYMETNYLPFITTMVLFSDAAHILPCECLAGVVSYYDATPHL